MLTDISDCSCSSDGKESACSAGDQGLIPGLGRSPGERNGSSLQYSCLENSMDRGAQWATVHGVAESDTTERLTYFSHWQHTDWQDLSKPTEHASTFMNSITWPLSRLPSLLTKCTPPTLNTLPVVKYRCESWTIKKAEHWGIDAFKLWCWRLLLSPLDSKKLQSVNPKENQNWIFIGRTHAEAPILWPPDVKSQLIGKASDAGKDWMQEGKRMTEDEMVGWHHRLNGHESEQAMGDSEGQVSLACCSLRGGRVGQGFWCSVRHWKTTFCDQWRHLVTEAETTAKEPGFLVLSPGARVCSVWLWPCLL